MSHDKTRRRTFLGAMAGLPGVPLLCGGAGAEPPRPRRARPAT